MAEQYIPECDKIANVLSQEVSDSSEAKVRGVPSLHQVKALPHETTTESEIAGFSLTETDLIPRIQERRAKEISIYRELYEQEKDKGV